MNIRSIVAAQDEARARVAEGARDAEARKLADQKELLRLNARAIERCLESVVKPVFAEAVRQLAGLREASLKEGKSNDLRLGDAQTLIEVEIVMAENEKGERSVYRLQSRGDADRGTVTTSFDLDGMHSTPEGGRNVSVADVTTEKIEGYVTAFIQDADRRRNQQGPR